MHAWIDCRSGQDRQEYARVKNDGIDCRSGQDRQEYARVKNDGIELGGMDWWKNIYYGKNMKIKLE